jgi:lipopolysaccharide/colanic/teichoic acid biosynthesis glycosyltransferase
MVGPSGARSRMAPVVTARSDQALWAWSSTREDRPAVSAAYLGVKRAADLILALSGIVILLPFWIAIAIAVRVNSPGPIIFRQKRSGQYGVPFQILKFRTMRLDAEEHLAAVLPLNEQTDNSLIRIRFDPRVTTVGKWLRAYSLDETPQLINIVLGQMSLVGPRPISRPIADPRGIWRLDAKPGLTGPWQISGRKDTTCETMLRLDMEYLETRSLRTDLDILLQTVPVVLAAKGAR